LARHLAEHPAEPGGQWVMPAAAGVLVGTLVLVVLVDHPSVALLPWGVLAAVWAFLHWRLMRRRQAEAAVQDVARHAMLRRHRHALRTAWNTLPTAAGYPMLRHRLIGMMAHCLDELRALGAARVAMDHLLEDLPEGHPMAIALNIQRAMIDLQTDHLADADAQLRRLREPAQQVGGVAAAGHRLALLLQDTLTGHHREALQQREGLVEALRPLGVDAGWGYGMMARCCQSVGASEGLDGDEAARWWDRATLLIPAHTLAERFEVLAPVRAGLGAGRVVPAGATEAEAVASYG
jgi:hypothetical protein